MILKIRNNSYNTYIYYIKTINKYQKIYLYYIINIEILC